MWIIFIQTMCLINCENENIELKWDTLLMNGTKLMTIYAYEYGWNVWTYTLPRNIEN